MTRFGFIEYEDDNSCIEAIRKLNMKNIWGSGKITVESAFVKESRGK